MRQRRGGRGWCVLVALAGAVGACETARNPGGVQLDRISPTIALSAADTQQIANGLQFSVDASDNLGLKEILVTFSNPTIAQTDTIFNTTVTSFNQGTKITFPANSGSGGSITITGRATDGAGNFTQATSVVFLSNVQALTVDLVAPTAPAVAATGKNILVQVHAQQLGGLERIGFIVVPRNAVVDPTTPPTDSVVFTPPARQPPDTFYTDTLTVQAGFTTFTVTGFAVDAAGRSKFTNPVTVTVQTPGNDVTPPTVSHTVSSRVEVNDNVTVHATDPSGIKVMGFRVDTALAAVPPFTGATHSLPFGGHIADAIYNSNRRELYLTNDVLGRVEVYNLATNTFDPNGIITAGPVPWGIALWPVDTLGTYDPNRVVVADAGGTELSILDASTRLLLWRQALPNFLIEKYSIQVISGFVRAVITVHDVSDRPQYLGTVCRVGATPPLCHADSIYAIYSTTPTQSSSSPFTGRATLRMEKLVNTNNPSLLFGHLFWELGDLGSNVAGDTLRIELVRPSLRVRNVVLTACRAVTIDFPSFGLGDQTFVRNTGNFTHAFVGEGGNVSAAFARVMSYSAKDSLKTPASSCNMTGTIIEPPPGQPGSDDVDFGMSPGVHVSDFISNTGVHVVSIATNFNGLTNLVRAGTDSTYYLDEGLRLWGTSAIGAGTPGMDMNYNHKFEPGGPCGVTCGGGSGNIAERMVFAASPDTSILAFDTYFFNQQRKIAIRDPIIGPLRVAFDATSGQQYLFGITARGLVVVSLPTITNTNPQAPRRP